MKFEKREKIIMSEFKLQNWNNSIINNKIVNNIIIAILYIQLSIHIKYNKKLG